MVTDKVSQLVMFKDNYNFPDIAKLTWAFARYHTNPKLPNFNADISSMLAPRDEYATVKATKHRIFTNVLDRLNQKGGKIEAAYLPMTLYAMSSLGYTDKTFYDTSILSFIPYLHDNLIPEDLGYTMHAMATNNVIDYNEFFSDALSSIFPKLLTTPSLKNELAIAQILSAIVQLRVDTAKIEDFQYHLGNIVDLLDAEITSDHTFMLSPMLWGLLGLNMYDPQLFDRCLNMLNRSNLTRYDSVFLHQVLTTLTQTGMLKNREFQDLRLLCQSMNQRHELTVLERYNKYLELKTGRDLLKSLKYSHDHLGHSSYETP